MGNKYKKDDSYLWDKDGNLIEDEDFFENPEAEEFHAVIKSGEYTATCIGTDVQSLYRGQRKVYLRFRLTGGEYDGVELFMACNFPKGKITRNYKYYKQWMMANGGPPHKGQRPARKTFVGKKFRILVGLTDRKHENDESMPEYMQYSVVKDILELLSEGDIGRV